MAIDTPAKLAILGAGPIGLEAALYARFLGYDVIVLEQGRVCEHIHQWGHAKLLTSFADNCSPLGLAAIEAQDENYQPPASDAVLTGRQWFEQYLQRLAETDLLSEHIFTNTRVLGVGKEQVRKVDLESDLPPGDERGDWPFRILVRDEAGNERIEMADGVLDCTGVYSQANHAGHGGLPAVGELGLRSEIIYHLPDVLEADRALFEDQRTLLIGDEITTAAAAVMLDELQQQSPATKFVWITTHETEPPEPINIAWQQTSPQRAKLAEQANRIARESQAWQWGTHLEQVTRAANDKFSVTLSGQLAGVHEFDRMLALVGYRGDASLFAELQVAANPVTGGNDPLKDIRQGEANFYILGSKSAGRNSQFLSFSDGLQQICAVFAIMGDRATLNLYGSKPDLKA